MDWERLLGKSLNLTSIGLFLALKFKKKDIYNLHIEFRLVKYHAKKIFNGSPANFKQHNLEAVLLTNRKYMDI